MRSVDRITLPEPNASPFDEFPRIQFRWQQESKSNKLIRSVELDIRLLSQNLHRYSPGKGCVTSLLSIFTYGTVNLVIMSSGNTMMTSSNENIFRVTGPLWGKSSGHRWIPLTDASDEELWCVLWSAPEQTAEQTIETPVIWEAHYGVTVMACHPFVTKPLPEPILHCKLNRQKQAWDKCETGYTDLHSTKYMY